jgi:GABA(A) receptor-associated protein
MYQNGKNDTNDVNMIILQQSNIKKHSKIDYTKESFTDDEKMIIKKEIEIIKEKYPNYIPIVVRTKGKNDYKLTKRKFLVSGDITVGQFYTILRKKMHFLKASEALFVFVNNAIPPSSLLLSSLYASEKDIETQMLFVTICRENTFGNNIILY